MTSITRPNNTTAYSAGAVIGSSTTLTAANRILISNIAGPEIIIVSSELLWNAASLPTGATSFALQLYTAMPPSAYADGAVWDLPAGDLPYYAGSINLGTPADLGSTLYVRQDGINAQFSTPDGSLYGYLVTTGGYTPAALGVYKYALHGVNAQSRSLQ